MCNECWKEFIGWCRAFTRVERALALLEAVLLVLLFGLLVFLILHMIVCSSPHLVDDSVTTTTEGGDVTDPLPTTQSDENHTTKHPNVKCTWEPSVKTKAVTHYYDTEADTKETVHTTLTTPDPYNSEDIDIVVDKNIMNPDEFDQSDMSDGEEVSDGRRAFVIALVKMKPPTDITFGCILTVISEYWVLTAASCIEAIEELDSLDSFVMMEEYGGHKNGQLHTIADLQVHPFYQETNKSYDVAALRSDDSLLRRDKRPVTMVFPTEDALLAIGERFHLLGYGAFRSIESGRGGRRLRVAYVYSVAARLCEGARGGGEGALRHLAGGRRGGDAPAPRARRLCAAVLAARGLPCNYCAGAPLLLPLPADAGRLLALMVDSPQCGVACEPQLYLPVVLVQDWIERVISQ